MRILFVILLLLSPGCYSNVTHIAGIEKDAFLKRHFTPEAYEVAKEIPIVESYLLSSSGLAAGTNFWSQVASFFMGCGIDRKIILGKEALGPDTDTEEHIIHEYIHHFHDMTLDGDFWIDEEEFIEAYGRCAKDVKYAGVVIMAERYGSGFITNTFGISKMAEYMAYAGSRAHMQSGPHYLERVFKRFLKPLR